MSKLLTFLPPAKAVEKPVISIADAVNALHAHGVRVQKVTSAQDYSHAPTFDVEFVIYQTKSDVYKNQIALKFYSALTTGK